MSDTASSKADSRSVSPDSIRPDHEWHNSVIDIGGGQMLSSLKDELEKKLIWKHGLFQKHRLLPASVLHDEKGLKMWKGITRLPQYYQTRDEIDLLGENGEELVRSLKDVNTLFDLGCGDIRKIEPLLDLFEKSKISIQYFALDLSIAVLTESMKKLKSQYQYVQCFGLWGTFNDALEWVQRIPGSKCYISMGSMFGNDHFDAAVTRLKSWADIMTADDRMLLGLDATQDKDTIWKSYHDAGDFFHQFIRNGFKHSNAILEHNWYHDEDWLVSGEFVDNPLMHQFVLKAVREVKCEALGINFPKGEKLVCYEGFKYEPFIMHKQFAASGLKKLDQWRSPSGRIYQYLLQQVSHTASIS